MLAPIESRAMSIPQALAAALLIGLLAAVPGAG
jgi:hypothetical protein